MVLQDTEKGPKPATMPNQQENQRQRNGGLVLGKPKFNWDATDRYAELLNFQGEVMNILKTGGYEINDDENILVIKN